MTGDTLAGLLLFGVLGFFVWQLVRIGCWLEDRDTAARNAASLDAGYCGCLDRVDERSR